MSTRRWLVVIVGLGAVLRLFPIWFGLPYMGARPDEEVSTGIARHMLATGDFNPHFFHWPSLTFYVFAAVHRAGSAIVRAGGFSSGLTDGQHIIICRAVVACAGSATLILLFSVGRRVAGETVALVATALLAVAVLHVRDSHFAMTDVLMTFLVTASIACLVRAIDTRRPWEITWWFALAGTAGGLATSTKYNAAAVLAAMAAAQACVIARGSRGLSPSAWAPPVVFMLAFALAFLAATPYALLDYNRFSADVRFDFTHLSEGHVVDLGRGWIYHATYSLPYGAGPAVFAASIPGAILLARNAPHQTLILGGFVVALYGSLGSGYTVFFRYILPLVPILCLMAAVSVVAAAEWIARGTKISRQVAYAFALALAVAPGLINSIWFDWLLARTDTRVLARRWLESHIGPGDSVFDGGGTYASIDLSNIPVARLPSDGRADWLILSESPVFSYARVVPEMRELARRQYLEMTVVAATGQRRGWAVYDLQDAFFLPVWGFWTVERPGPTLRIYRRKPLDVRGSAE